MANGVNGNKPWLDKLGPREVPVFRRTARLLTELAEQGEKVKLSDVASVILADPLMTLRILHDANARGSKRLGSEIATVEHALMRLGLNVFFEKYKKTPTVEDALSGQAKALQAAYELLQHSYHVSWQARDFAVLHLDTRAEEVEIAALLAGATELLLCLAAPEAAIKLRRLRRKLKPVMAEVEVLGDSMESLQQAVLAAWIIPEELREMMRSAQDMKPRQIMVQSALKIERIAEHGWWHKELSSVYGDVAELLGRQPQQVASSVHGNAMHAARAGAWIPFPAVARWLPMLPGEWPPEPEEEEAEQPAAAKPAASKEPAPKETTAACPVPNKRIFDESLKAIENHLDGTLTLTQMSAQILRGLHSGLGLSRILFAMLTPDGTRVKSRFTLGVATEDPLRHFEFRLANKDMFGQLMSRMQGVWLNSSNRNRMWPMVHPNLQQIIGEGDFYAMSLFAGNKPIGMIYADRGHGVCDLDPATYTDFKLLCLQAARGLAKAKPG